MYEIWAPVLYVDLSGGQKRALRGIGIRGAREPEDLQWISGGDPLKFLEVVS